MPGIVGIVGPGPADEHQRQVGTMLRTLMHEPSYVSGAHSCPDLGVYAAWAAHPQSYAARFSAARTPGDLALAFAGECFPAAGEQLAAGAVDPLTKYRNEGTGFVASLNGLFSGVLIDQGRRRAIVFNDRYAGERLYYYESGDTLYFASEAKALLAVIPEARRLNDDAVAQLLAYGSTTSDVTLFHNVKMLPGGTAWLFQRGSRPSRTRYFQPLEWEQQPPLDDVTFEERFVEVARSVLPTYAQADVPVGISITGGLDTRMIMAALPPDLRTLVCYTYAALSGETLDVRIGRRVSKALGLEHHTVRMKKEFLDDFGAYLDQTVLVTDGCAGTLSTHEIFLTGVARSLAPIRLTGNFGSEVLRSMSTLSPRKLAPELVEAAFRSAVDRARSRQAADNPVTQSAFGEVPLHLFGSMAAARSLLTFRTPYLDNALVQLAYRASPAARNSPRAALNLIGATNPALAKMPTDRGVSLGARAATNGIRRLFCEATFKLDYMDKEGLSGVLLRFDPLFGMLSRTPLLGLHKFLPYRGWFRNELAGYVADVVGSTRTQSQPYWNRQFLRTMAQDHARGRRNNMQEISSVLTIEAVQRVLVESSWQSAQSTNREQLQ